MNAVEGEEGEDDDADGGQAYKIGEGEPHGDLLGFWKSFLLEKENHRSTRLQLNRID